MAASVLCAVDDSPTAAKVIGVAARLREGLGLRLVIAHAAPEPIAMGMATYAYRYQSDSELSQDAAEAVLEGIVQGSPDAEGAELRAVIGDTVETLLSLADEEDAELLVVGSRGRGPLKAALLGSVSSSVATRATCPVVVVPPEATLNG